MDNDGRFSSPPGPTNPASITKPVADKNIVFRCYHFAPGENGFIRPESGDRFRFVGRDPPTERGTESLTDLPARRSPAGVATHPVLGCIAVVKAALDRCPDVCA